MLETIWDMRQLDIKGELFSLNDIEINRLSSASANPSGKVDARIHSCITCASVSCPNLRIRAYTVENISNEMDENTWNMLANQKKGVAIDNGSLKLSKIFDWFKDDYDSNNSSVKSFVYKYAPMDIRYFMSNHTDASITYFTFNWNVNGNIADACTKNRTCFPWWALLCLLLGLLIAVIVTAVCIRRMHKLPYSLVGTPGLN